MSGSTTEAEVDEAKGTANGSNNKDYNTHQDNDGFNSPAISYNRITQSKDNKLVNKILTAYNTNSIITLTAKLYLTLCYFLFPTITANVAN